MAQICTRVSVSYRGHKNSGSGSVVKLLMRDEVLVVTGAVEKREWGAVSESSISPVRVRIRARPAPTSLLCRAALQLR